MAARVRQLFAAAFVLFGMPLAVVGAAHAQAVVQSYGSDTPLQPGVIVELQGSGNSKVEPLAQTDATKMFGVVISPNDSSVTLSTNNNQQTFVATSGDYNVLVSNQSGAIKAGDYITISSLDGIGMKAGGSDLEVLGKALNSFSGSSSDSIGSTTLKNSTSQTTVQLGRIAVAINISSNPLKQPASSNLPSFLRQAGQGVVNKPVSTSRLYLSLLVLAVVAIIAGSLLYSGVRSSITAIGRNPLSRKSVMRSLIQVTLISFIVFIIGLLGVYLLLRF